MAAFTHGFFSMKQQACQAVLSDLCMGQEPNYVFSFAVAEQPAGTLGNTGKADTADTADTAGGAESWQTITPVNVGTRGNTVKLPGWLWPRMLGQPLPPPR